MSDLDKCYSALLTFKKQYSNIPGLMTVKVDDWFSEYIICFIDKKKYINNSIPDEYETFPIFFIDPYEQIKRADDMKNRLIAETSSNSINNIKSILKTIMQHYHNISDYNRQVIEEYENK